MKPAYGPNDVTVVVDLTLHNTGKTKFIYPSYGPKTILRLTPGMPWGMAWGGGPSKGAWMYTSIPYSFSKKFEVWRHQSNSQIALG